MNSIYKLILLTILTLLPAIVLALSPKPPDPDPVGPVVPCVGCENLTEAPYPETGLWSNPQQSSGSGLNFEIQNGVLAGYLYTYSDTGQPEWFIVSGALVRSEKEGVMWELVTRLTRVEGGSCIGCSFTPPDQITEGIGIRLEFMQRNYLRVQMSELIGGGVVVVFNQFFVPFMYGSVGKAYFNKQTPYIFPEFGPNQSTLFIISLRPTSVANNDSWYSQHVHIAKAYLAGTPENRIVTYSMWKYDPHGPVASPVPPPWGQIICEVDTVSVQPGCRIEVEGVIYIMPAGNLSDSRFFAEAEDGSIIEAFRIEYD